ncbi:MAG: hypothetical protein ACI4BD_00180 [Paludibacteraceae bacterium]
MKKQFLGAMAAVAACLAVLSGCEGLSSYSTFYDYSWSVSGPSNPSNANKLEAYLIELGAPVKNGQLNNATVQIQGISEADCNQKAIQQFNEVISKIDYAKVKAMGIGMQNTFTYRLMDSRYNPIAEWKYPNPEANLDTVVTHSLLSIRMVFGADLPKYCEAKVLLNGDVVKTLAEGDTIYKADFEVTNFPQDALFQAQLVKKADPEEGTVLHLNGQYYYLLTNRNAADEIVSSSVESALTEGTSWGTSSVLASRFDKWLERYQNRGIVLFHIDGKNTEGVKQTE